MFSWNKKKEKPKKRTTARPSNSKQSPFDEFGIGAVPQPDDEELEAELRAITGKVLVSKLLQYREDLKASN